MNKRVSLTVISCFIAIVSMAQVLTIKNVETRLITNQGVEFLGRLIDENSDVYMNPTWRNIGVLYIDGKEYRISNINYNISKSTVSSQLKNGKYFVFNRNDVSEFSINNKLFKKNGSRYYEVLVEEGNAYFYKRYDVKFQEAGLSHRVSGARALSSKRSITYAYLIKTPDVTKTIGLNKKSILNLFATQEEELKQFVEDNNLSFKKEKDMIQIVSYMLRKSIELT